MILHIIQGTQILRAGNLAYLCKLKKYPRKYFGRSSDKKIHRNRRVALHQRTGAHRPFGWRLRPGRYVCALPSAQRKRRDFCLRVR